MRKALIGVVLAAIVLTGCAIKTQSILPENKGKGVHVTELQAKQEQVELDKRIAARKAAFEKAKAENSAELDQMFSEIQAEIDYRNAVVEAAKADIAQKAARRDYVFNIVGGTIEAVVPPGYSALAALGLAGIAGVVGVKKTLTAARERKGREEATAAVKALVQAIAKTGSTAAAKMTFDTTANRPEGVLIDKTVTETKSDIVQDA